MEPELNKYPQRISDLTKLESIKADLKKQARRISPAKMVRLRRVFPDDELSTHIDIVKLIIGEGYIMTPEHEYLIKGMIYYFNGMEEKAKEYGFHISKGIGITGAWGVGKTTLFGAFHEYLAKLCQIDYNPNTYRITSLDEIADMLTRVDIKRDFSNLFLLNSIETGDGTIKHKPIHICINELGVRYDIKNYGSDINEMIDIFLAHRYDIFIKYGKVTHMTTNYGAKDLEKIFSKGNDRNQDVKLPDRFKEMWNMRNLKGESFRK